MSLLLDFTNWKQICAISEIQIENRMPFYKSKSGLWPSWITVPKHDSVFPVKNRSVTRLKHKFFYRHVNHCYSRWIFLGNNMESNLLHVCFGNLWNRYEPRFCNRHVCYQGHVCICRVLHSLFFTTTKHGCNSVGYLCFSALFQEITKSLFFFIDRVQ